MLVLGASDFLHSVDKTDEAIWFTTPKQIFIHQDFNTQVKNSERSVPTGSFFNQFLSYRQIQRPLTSID